MSVAELKMQLISKITNTNDETVLQQILSFLEGAMEKADDGNSLSKNYDAIKAQDGDVLQKLAQ